jgi:hypothetical protein
MAPQAVLLKESVYSARFSENKGDPSRRHATTLLRLVTLGATAGLALLALPLPTHAHARVSVGRRYLRHLSLLPQRPWRGDTVALRIGTSDRDIGGKGTGDRGIGDLVTITIIGTAGGDTKLNG